MPRARLLWELVVSEHMEVAPRGQSHGHPGGRGYGRTTAATFTILHALLEVLASVARQEKEIKYILTGK